MSEVERRKGKLIPTEMTFERVLEICGISEETFFENYHNDSKESDWYDLLLCSGYYQYLYLNNKWYELNEEQKLRNSEYFSDIVLNEDGTIDYHCQFYNGGTCLTEILEDYLKKN